MRTPLRLVLALLFCLSARAAVNVDWTTPLSPFQIADHLYYVGSRDLAAYLVTTPAGNILINANLESSPTQIRASVERLGFRWRDTKILLNGQAHFDHMAGAARILRETGAKDMVMEGDAEVVLTGGRSDFARVISGLPTFAPARVDRVLRDGNTVSLGGVVLTAHLTGGHTRGCTTWTFETHMPGEPAGRLRKVVIVGGVAALSEYRLVAGPGLPTSYPGIAEAFEHTFATLRGLPCDIFLGAHGVYFGMLEKLGRMPKAGLSVWIDPAGYAAFVKGAQEAVRRKMMDQGSDARADYGSSAARKGVPLQSLGLMDGARPSSSFRGQGMARVGSSH